MSPLICAYMLFGGDAPQGPPVAAGLLRAPGEGLGVQLGDILEAPPRQEVALHEPDEPFDFAFGEGMPRLAQPRLEADACEQRRKQCG